MPTENTVTRELIVNLSEAELRERGDEMALAELDAAKLAEERKQLNAAIRAHTDKRKRLATVIDTRKETREVVCEWVPNYQKKRWQLVRADNRDKLPEERDMTPVDLQQRLDVGSEPKALAADSGGARARKKGARKAAKRS